MSCLQGRIRIKGQSLQNDAIKSSRIALTADGTSLYPAVEPIVPNDIHTIDEYRKKLVEFITYGQFTLKTPSSKILDARTAEYIPPS